MLPVLSQFLEKLIYNCDECVYLIHVLNMSCCIAMYITSEFQFVINLYHLYNTFSTPVRGKDFPLLWEARLV